MLAEKWNLIREGDIYRDVSVYLTTNASDEAIYCALINLGFITTVSINDIDFDGDENMITISQKNPKVFLYNLVREL